MSRLSPALNLQRSPLVLVLAQVRVSPVLAMSKYVPKIQEALRKADYPRFRTLRTAEIKLGAQPELVHSERWVFANTANTEAVVLARDFVVLVTTRYDRFEEFSDRLTRALETTGEIVDLSLSHRLGLRYVDLILPQEGESLDEYLERKLHGLSPADLAIDKVLNHFESRGETPLGRLVVRLHQNEQGALLPPDLDPEELSFEHVEPVEPGRVITLLDIDHYSIKDRDYDVSAIIDAMWGLHEHTDKAFRSSVTREAIGRWGGT